MEAPFVHVLRYGEDGRLTRGEFYGDTAKAARLLD